MKIDQSTLDKIKRGLKNNGYFIYKKFINKEICLLAKNEYFACQINSDLHSQAEVFLPKDLLEKCWRKTAIGSGNGLGEKYSQVLQTTYIPLKETEGFKNLSFCFKEAVQLRNQLTNMERDFGFEGSFETGTYWNALRIHHYPCGGGHMAEHADTYFPSILSESNIPFVQVAICLSNRSIDFNEGGGFIIDRSNKKVFFEDAESMGSVIIFDGSMRHGVDDIDPGKVLDWRSNQGRIALFSNLYVNR